MRVLHIGKYYEPYLGGIENAMYNLCHTIKNRVTVTALTYNTKNETEEYDDKGIHVVKVATIGKIRSQPISFELVKWIKTLSKDADIIHLHFPNPLAEIAYLIVNPKNKKLIITYHSDITKQKILLNIYKPFLYRLLNRADYIIATTEKYANSSKILSQYNKKIRIVSLGINPNKFKLNNKNEVQQIQKKYGKNIILFVGRLIYYKGLEYLIESLKYCKNVNLIVIGSGNCEKSLKEQYKKLRLKNVHFLGNVKNLVPYYQACKFLVLPSIERSEAFGIVLLEAMACGKAVITTEINSGNSYINKNRCTGIVVPPKNSKALALAINSLLRNLNILTKYGKNAKKRVLKLFTYDINATKTVEIYKKVMMQNA